jgi:hypothetical protein
VLGPDDHAVIYVVDLDEIGNRPFRMDMDGNLNVSLTGRLHAACRRLVTVRPSEYFRF